MDPKKEKPCVLVVDDVAENIDVLAGALASDYEVKVALNGEDALDIALSQPFPDLILLDITMPGMDGYEVCRKLRANAGTEDIPVIFVTAMSEMADETKGFDVGGVDYITKPIRTPIVLARVKAHLELKQAREQLKDQNRILKENLRLREDVENIIRHDLKTPLNVCMWAPDLLKIEGNLSSSQLETVHILKQASYSMLQIINSSINLIKMERGEYNLQANPVNLIKPLSQIENEMSGLMRTRGVVLNVQLNGMAIQKTDEFIIAGEEILFYTMLANLIKNAMEASPKGETVYVSLTDDTALTIQIRNLGAVPNEIRERFFDKYVTGGKVKGTGLGTYSARMIAETLNGAIKLDTSEETGTTITITFPKP